jgi:tight adherence protein B
MLIGIIFCFILLVVFGLVMLITRPTANENATARRLEEMTESRTQTVIRSAQARSEAASAGAAADIAQTAGSIRSRISESKIARELRSLTLQSHVNISVMTAVQIIIGVACIVGLVVWYFTSSWVFAAMAAAIAGFIPIAYLRYRRKKWLAAFNDALPECIETTSRALRAGNSIIAAIGLVAEQNIKPASAEFAEVFKKQRYGLTLREALLQMIDRVPSMDLKIMVTAFLVQRDTGGNLADMLDRLVTVIRERQRIQRDVRIHTAQGRMTGWVLCLLPGVLMIAVNLISPGYSHDFINDPVGKRLLYASVVLLFAGVLIIRQIIRGIEV